MTGVVRAIAALAEHEIRAQFSGDDRSPMVRVTCAKDRAEIVALVKNLRGWAPPAGLDALRVVVTAGEVWEGLEETEVVPRGDESPTTLRNLHGVGVILIEGDDYTDRQSWQSVRPISDGRLLHEPGSRERLAEFALGRTAPKLLVDALEEVYAAVRQDEDDLVSLRSWVGFVLAVCKELRSRDVLDAGEAWCRIGSALPVAGLFRDDGLAGLSRVDRGRRLRSNYGDSRRLFAEADDTWRDALEDRLPGVEFVDIGGAPESDAEGIRRDLASTLRGEDDGARARVLFRHWLQLTSSKKERVGLGSRIREVISERGPDRVAEYDDLGVEEGINAGAADDAQTLLDAQPPRDDLPALVRLLDSKVVAAVERVANPRSPTTLAPVAELVRTVADMVAERAAVDDDGGTEGVSLRIETRKESEEAVHSRALFAWLFGPTLQSVRDAVDGELLCLDIDPSLLDASPLGEFERADSETDDEDDEGAFDTLELRLKWSDGAARERRVDWKPRSTPGLVALWRLSNRPDAFAWNPGEEVTFDTWLVSATHRSEMVGALPLPEDAAAVAGAWNTDRTAALAELAESGLRSDWLQSIADRYTLLLRELRDNYVPSGTARPEVAEVLRCDMASWKSGPVVLATHPIRLRWVARYLDRMAALVTAALRGELLTNPVNQDLFFSELLGLSPQAQPPVAVVGDQLCLAVREQDWHEVFRPLKDERGERRDWLADLDDGAIDDVGETIARFLDAYPHKADGLHVLYIVRRNGARGLGRLVRNVTKSLKVTEASLRLTLFVDPVELRVVEEVLQEFDDADHRARSDRPPIDVDVHRWNDPEIGLPDLRGLRPFVDVAVVPNLFGAATRTHDGTRDSGLDRGRFDPLLDEPTRLEPVNPGGGPSAAVSRVLLPQGADELLEAWSTISTRQFRGSPISDNPSESDVDHVTIRVSLDKNRDFFDALHACAQWVVTVDAFVGREQIEALENGPDVIRVKTGVGANGAYRLVVSSSAGRPFVERRIARRLRQQLPVEALRDPEALARSIYDRSRLLVPGIVLRSLGLGRTAAEMVGLVLARSRVEQVDPALVGPHGFQSWLSLDEHPEWSGGHQSTRADLARIRGWMDGRTLVLQVDVVEAKMRTQVALGRAERQIQRSIDLLQAAFGLNGEGGPGYADGDMWRRLVWRAIEQTSTAIDGTPAATHVLAPDGPRSTLDDELRGALQEGNVRVLPVGGVLVSLTSNEVAEDRKTPSGFRWLELSLAEVRAELHRLSEPPAYPLALRAGPVAPPPKPELGDGASGSTSGWARGPEPSGEIRPPGPEPGPKPAPRPRRGGRSRAALARMQNLLDALSARGLEVSPEGTDDDALEGPGFYLLRVSLAPNHRPQQVSALAEDLQYHLSLDAGQLPRIYVDRGAVVVEIPKREEERYYIDANELWARTEWPNDRLYAPLGCDVRDEPIGVDFSSSRSPHLLIGGMTGGGKSVALETLLLGLVRHYPSDRLELRIIDPKGNEFAEFEQMEHVAEPPGMDAEDAIEMLERTCEEMDARYRAMKDLTRSTNARVRDVSAYNELVSPDERFKWIVVVLDEFADLTAEKESKKVIEGLLQRIAQKARAAGIHAIVATQKPSAEVISTTTRSNLGAQLALRVRSATDSRVIMEATGAESLAGNGDGFLRLSGGEPVRLQCARVVT